MKKLLLGALLLLSTLSFSQITITKWDFDQSTNSPSVGTGIFFPYNTSDEWGNTCNCPYQIGNPSSGKSYSVQDFPIASPGTSGYQLSTSTLGYSGISISFDISGTDLASKYFQCQYSINDTDYISFINSSINSNGTGNMQWTNINQNLPIETSNVNNLYIRIVSIYGSSCCSYDGIWNSTNYNTQGKWRIDNIIVNATSLSTNQNTLSELGLYPNPTNGSLYLSTNTDKNIKIYDMIGNKIIDKDVTNFLDTSNLSNGIYLCEIKEGENKLIKKIVKN
jgi:hypothetical protein